MRVRSSRFRRIRYGSCRTHQCFYPSKLVRPEPYRTRKHQRRNSDMAATEQEILEGLGKIINEITGIPVSDVTPEKNFVDDLDIDSLSMVEIAVAAQDEFGVEIPDDQLKNLKTVKDVLTFIQN